MNSGATTAFLMCRDCGPLWWIWTGPECVTLVWRPFAVVACGRVRCVGYAPESKICSSAKFIALSTGGPCCVLFALLLLCWW